MILELLIPLIIASSTPSPWLAATVIKVPWGGDDVVTNFNLDQVCVTHPGQKTVLVFNSRGQVVRTLSGVETRADESMGDWWIVMDDGGRIVDARGTSRHVSSSPIGKDPRIALSQFSRREYRAVLSRDNLSKSFQFRGVAGLRFTSSVGNDELFFRSNSKFLSLIAFENGSVRRITPWITYPASSVDVSPVAALAKDEYLGMAFIFDSSGNTVQLPGVPIYGGDDAKDKGVRMDVQYLVTINTVTGSCSPIAGFVGWDDSLRLRAERTVGVFNTGKSIAVNHLGRLYILKRR